MNTPQRPMTPVPPTEVSREPVNLSRDRAMIARLYDACSGGHDAYWIEWDLLSKLASVVEHANFIFTSEIEFLHRAARYLAEVHKIEQFVVSGIGFPRERGEIHEVIHRHRRDARVWYVDHEPVVLAHLRALATDSRDEGRVQIVNADPLAPITMWNRLAEQEPHGDNGPIGLLLGGVLSFHPGTRADAAAVAQQHIEHLPPGSVVVLSHLFDPELPGITAKARQLADQLTSSPIGAGSVASRAEIEAMVAGTTILAPALGAQPGIVPAYQWWRDGPALTAPKEARELVAGLVVAVG